MCKGTETGQDMVPTGGGISLQRLGQRLIQGMNYVPVVTLPVLSKSSGSPIILGTCSLFILLYFIFGCVGSLLLRADFL